MTLYLDEVARHADLMERQARLVPDSESGEDMNWLIRQSERRIDEARKAFLAHRANHPK
jgi:hypothetical protein